jgi:hypothetical protein
MMKASGDRRGRIFLAAGIAAATVASWVVLLSSMPGGAGKKKQAPPNILADRSAGIIANHAHHVFEVSLSCDHCHKTAPSSGKAGNYLVPRNEVCLECHEEAICKGDFVEACRQCHRKKPVSYTTLMVKHAKRVEVIFPHKDHIEGKASPKECLSCHVLKTKKPVPPAACPNPELPRMTRCLECHDHLQEYQALLCDTCHLTKKGGTLKQKLPGGILLKPPSWMSGLEHDGFWHKEHEAAAANHGSMCAACHVNEDCDTCHAGTGQPRPTLIHPDDWIIMHGLSSRGGDLRCTSCHNLQHFCLPCHRRSGAAWDSPEGLDVPSGAVFHPEGWYSFSGSNKHGIEARHSLTSCVSCHTEYDCMLCHASPFEAFNPHPPPSIWHQKCRTLYKKNPGVCLKCHTAVPSICK